MNRLGGEDSEVKILFCESLPPFYQKAGYETSLIVVFNLSSFFGFV